MLQTNEEPAEREIFIASQAAKKYLINKEQFFRDEQEVLWNKSKNNLTRLVVPNTFVTEVLSLHHDLPVMGHQGIDRTLARIKVKFYWYKMQEAVKTYVRSCKICSKHKKAT